MKLPDYTISLRRDTPSRVGGLDATGPVLVNSYPMPAAVMPYQLASVAEFEGLPATAQQLERRAKIYALQRELLAVPGASSGPEPVHTFGPGFYVRRLTLPAGVVIVSKRHAREHVFMILSGSATCYTEDGATLLRGPHEFVSPAGAKRVLLVHEEAVFVTVHPTTAATPVDVERDVILSEMEVLQ